jgi:hypothetical protein
LEPSNYFGGFQPGNAGRPRHHIGAIQIAFGQRHVWGLSRFQAAPFPDWDGDGFLKKWPFLQDPRRRYGIVEIIDFNGPGKIIDFNDIDFGSPGHVLERGAEEKEGIGGKGRKEKVVDKPGAGK